MQSKELVDAIERMVKSMDAMTEVVARLIDQNQDMLDLLISQEEPEQSSGFMRGD